jgi:RNase P protein component
MSRCLFSFVSRACPSRPFYALRATPKTALNFGWSVGRSVGRSVTGKSHKRHIASSVSSPGPALPDSSMPCGPPRKQPSILVGRSDGRSDGRSISWSIGHREVTRTSLCLFSFVTWTRPSRPFYALRATPKTALNFGWLVGWLVVRSVTGKSHERHAASSVSAPRPTLPDPSTPCGPPQNGLKFWLVGWSVSRSVTGKSHERHAAYSVSSPGPALPDPSTPCAPPPKQP